MDDLESKNGKLLERKRGLGVYVAGLAIMEGEQYILYSVMTSSYCLCHKEENII